MIVLVLVVALLALAPAAYAGPAVPLSAPTGGPAIGAHIALAGDPATGRVLAVWPRVAGSTSETVARPVRLSGQPAGAVRAILAGGGPEGSEAAWDGERRRYLVASVRLVGAPPSYSLATRLVAADGKPVGPARTLPVSGDLSLSVSDISVSYSPKSDEYLAAYTVEPLTGRKVARRVEVQRLDAGGKPIGPPAPRVERRSAQLSARVVPMRGGGHLLVYAASSVVRARPLDPRGALAGAGDVLVSGAGAQRADVARVAADRGTGRFLVTWVEGTTENNKHTMLRTLAASGRPDGAPRRGPQGSTPVAPAADPSGKGWLFAWRADGFQPVQRVVVQRTDARGVLRGAPSTIASGGVWEPSLIGLEAPGRYLAAWGAQGAAGGEYVPTVRRIAAG